jgi:hypothetical protein
MAEIQRETGGEMKKPAWVSFFGWAFLFCVGMFLPALFLRNDPQFTSAAALGAVLFFFVSFPCLFLWVVGSIVYSVQRKGAELQAASLSSALRQAGIGSSRASGGTRGAAAPPGAIAVRGCQVCRTRAATVHCNVHDLDVCNVCADAHTQMGVCKYVPPAPLNLPGPADADNRPRVITSPLGLTGTDRK